MTHISREDALRELSGIVGRQFFGASGSYYDYELRTAYQKSLEALASRPSPADREAIVEECAQTIERCGARDALSIAVIVRRLAGETPGPSTLAAKRFSSVSESRHGEPAPVFTDCQGNNPEPRDPAPASAEGAETLHDEFRRLVAEYRAGGEHSNEAWNLIADFAEQNADAIAAGLAASPLGQEWRTIESAPKDGAYLIANARGEVCPCDSREGQRIVHNVPGFADWTWPESATHWMPLPAPPTLASAQAPEGDK